MKSLTALALLSALSLVLAHEETQTPDQAVQHRHRQESIYHCAPQIAAYTAERKRAPERGALRAEGVGLGEDKVTVYSSDLKMCIVSSNSTTDLYLPSLPSQAQAVLNGGATDASTMFLNSAFEKAQDEDKVILECGPVEEVKMRNHTCVLAPEVTQGPYYHLQGHPIRQNLAEEQLGLLFLMDVGVIDVKTCLPVPNVLVDLWHANTTGHYAGHADPDPALYWEGPAPTGFRKGLLTKFPRWNDVETWLRGAWPTSKNGVAQFTSIYPGYYTGRATHVHIKVHTEWEPHANGTFTTGRLVHTGQLFFDDNLDETINKLSPYNINPIKDKWGRTRNWEDSLKVYQDAHTHGYGATFDLQKVGGVIQQGIIGYITVGVDLGSDWDRSATQQAGGVPEPDSGKAKKNVKTEL